MDRVYEKKEIKFSTKKLIIVCFMLMLFVAGGTFALLDISITNGNYAYKTTCFDVVYDAGEDITGTLFPSRKPIGGLNGSITIGIDQSCGVSATGNFYLTASSSSSGGSKLTEVVAAHCENKSTLETVDADEASCISNSENVWVTTGTALKYAVYLADDTSNPLSVGYVDKIDEAINIYEGFEVTASTQYTIYIWLDGELVDNSYLNLPFSAGISAEVIQLVESINIINYDLNGGSFETLYSTSGNHVYNASTGTYKLEVWGAQGGAGNSIGGYGAYSVGNISLSSDTQLYVYVGGKGLSGTSSNTTVQGGYNGGGQGSTDGSGIGGSGGGASHIATVDGLLSTLSSNLDDILIVAGGGGGAAGWSGNSSVTVAGGNAGGINGSDGNKGTISSSSGSFTVSTGGSQSSGGIGVVGSEASGSEGTFGLGGASGTRMFGGGGGGFYGGGGGGAAYYTAGSGGGGSGYIGNSLLTDKVMYCYECTTSSDESTLTYSTTNVSETATSYYAKSEDGAVKITYLDTSKSVVYGAAYGILPIPVKDGYIFKEWNTKADGSGDVITDDTLVTIAGDHTLYAIWE